MKAVKVKKELPKASLKKIEPSKMGPIKIWRLMRWPLLAVVLAYAALVLYRIPAVGEGERTATAVANIQARKISMADVLGTNLPPQPYASENEATVAGLDKNNNGVRDDVELAIFAKYPGSAKIRAAELQYAMTEQMFLTEVFNTETWKAVAQQHSRGFACVGQTIPSKNIQMLDLRIKEVDDLVFNTEQRKDSKNIAYNFTTSYGDQQGVSDCDIDLNSLPN